MSFGLEKARELHGQGTHAEQCDRAIAAAVRELDEQRAATDRVRTLHGDCVQRCGRCHECGGSVPCRTIRALDGAE